MSVKAELKLNRISALDPSEFHVQLLICNISCPASPVAGPRGGLVKKKKSGNLNPQNWNSLPSALRWRVCQSFTLLRSTWTYGMKKCRSWNWANECHSDTEQSRPDTAEGAEGSCSTATDSYRAQQHTALLVWTFIVAGALIYGLGIFFF